ncbi:unnamed protein product [Cylindrotheca closterium]|uniref:Nudix hydrolase domain-containing protein n=1 Tax=Cylindrotheca closterium TaxID=2856 RepID=A0AAD2G2I4_9STRA|nr:unnamed protein product [Cylindrotheca closterium]
MSSSSTPVSFDALLDFHQKEESLSPYFPTTVEEKEADLKIVEKVLETSDLRGFGILIHREHGLVMLQCSKPKKGKPVPHFQIPGGHVDKFEIEEQQKKQPSNPWAPIYEAAKRGCVREIWEETGMDLRESLDRVRPLWLGAIKTNKGMRNEHKDRIFFVLEVSDSDFLTKAPEASVSHGEAKGPGLVGPLNLSSETEGLKLNISFEHTGFQFEKNPEVAIEAVQHHSGGKVSEALRRAFRSLEASTKEP